MKKLLVFMAALLISASVCGESMAAKKTGPEPISVEAMQKLPALSTVELNREFRDNPIAAKKKYDGQWVKIQGEVTFFDELEATSYSPKRFMVSVWTRSKQPNMMGSDEVTCLFAEKHEAQIMQLKKGQKVEIIGWLVPPKYATEVPRLRDCVFAPAK